MPPRIHQKLNRSEVVVPGVQQETKALPLSFNQPEQIKIPFDNLAKFFNEQLFNKKLFVLSDIVDDDMPGWGHVQRVAKMAVQKTNTLNDETKKQLVIYALGFLAKNKQISIKKKGYILTAMECFLLSSRISNARALGIFSKRITQGYQHTWTWEGIKLALSAEHPHLNVHFLFYSSRLAIPVRTMDKIDADLQKNSVWLVVGNENSHNLMLIRMQLKNNELAAQVLDSLSTRHHSLVLYNVLDAIISTLKVNKCTIEAFAESRELSVHLNFYVLSLYFVLSDLNTALNLIQEEKPLFLSEPTESKISDTILLKTYSSSKNPLFAYTFDSRSPEISNGIAILAKLVTKNQIVFRPENNTEESESENDEIVGGLYDTECSLM